MTSITICDLCRAPMAAMPGPANREPRPDPPIGHRIGYIVEVGTEGVYTICSLCLHAVINIAA